MDCFPTPLQLFSIYGSIVINWILFHCPKALFSYPISVTSPIFILDPSTLEFKTKFHLSACA